MWTSPSDSPTSHMLFSSLRMIPKTRTLSSQLQYRQERKILNVKGNETQQHLIVSKKLVFSTVKKPNHHQLIMYVVTMWLCSSTCCRHCQMGRWIFVLCVTHQSGLNSSWGGSLVLSRCTRWPSPGCKQQEDRAGWVSADTQAHHNRSAVPIEKALSISHLVLKVNTHISQLPNINSELLQYLRVFPNFGIFV